MKNAKQHFLDRQRAQAEIRRQRCAKRQAPQFDGSSITIQLKISTPARLSDAHLLKLIKDELIGVWLLGGIDQKYPIKFKVNP